MTFINEESYTIRVSALPLGLQPAVFKSLGDLPLKCLRAGQDPLLPVSARYQAYASCTMGCSFHFITLVTQSIFLSSLPGGVFLMWGQHAHLVRYSLTEARLLLESLRCFRAQALKELRRAGQGTLFTSTLFNSPEQRSFKYKLLSWGKDV